MSCTKLPISLVCDSCGHRMPKASKIAVTHDVTRNKEGIVAYGSKMYLDCTNCLAEMMMERKANGEYVILSGATPYFLPEDEKLECPPKVRTTYYCTRNGNLDSSGGVASSTS